MLVVKAERLEASPDSLYQAEGPFRLAGKGDAQNAAHLFFHGPVVPRRANPEPALDVRVEVPDGDTGHALLLPRRCGLFNSSADLQSMQSMQAL